jgi:ABC-type multidrug transport system, ATPase component
VVGPNGSGKSTLLKIISGCIEGYLGSSFVDGVNIVENHKKCVRKIGALIENPHLYSYVNSYDMLQLAYKLRNGRNGNEDEIDKSLNQVGLMSKKDIQIRDLSSGEKKRLSIGLALVGSPDIIILDEPTNNMDAEGVSMFQRLINQLRDDGNRLIIITSHELDIIGKICDRLIFLINGQIRRDFIINKEGYFLILQTDRSANSVALRTFKTELLAEGKIAVLIENEDELNDLFRTISERGIKIKSIEKMTQAEFEYKKAFNQ